LEFRLRQSVQTQQGESPLHRSVTNQPLLVIRTHDPEALRQQL